MSTTYTWTITKMGCLDPDEDGDCATITSASWDLSGTDGTNTALINGITPLNVSMLDGEDPEASFSTLSQATVIAAVQAALGINQVNSFYSSIDTILTDLLTPQPISPVLPWVV